MKITERDLFDFVFNPEILSQEKAEYLKSSQIFEEEINLFKLIKQSLTEELDDSIKQQIKAKIPLYQPLKVYTLFPIQDNSKKKKNGTAVFAAASPQDKTFVTTQTFIDEANHYLIRLLNFKSSSKIYVFSTIEKTMENYKIIIRPSGQIFEQADNSSPIEINKPLSVEKIDLQFN